MRDHISVAWLISAAGVIAAPVAAAPTYLVSSIPNGARALAINIMADEADQIATINIPETGLSDRRPAIFTPGTETFTTPLPPAGVMSYEVNRTDLSIKRVLSVGANVISTDVGACKVQAIPKRAF